MMSESTMTRLMAWLGVHAVCMLAPISRPRWQRTRIACAPLSCFSRVSTTHLSLSTPALPFLRLDTIAYTVLTTDMCLTTDKSFRKYVDLYAADNDTFINSTIGRVLSYCWFAFCSRLTPLLPYLSPLN